MPTLSAGDVLEVVAEKAVVGGRMLARVGGEVVLVSGTIPGERVTATVERRQQGVLLARTTRVIEASPDRRDPGPDPACGGMTFAHIAYPRQCELKAAIVADALGRIGKLSVEATVPLTPSPTRGYRARYRVHAAGGMLGFYREGTHQVCDTAASGQLDAASLACLEALAARLPPDVGDAVNAFEYIENLPNSQRAVNLAMRPGSAPGAELVAGVASTPGITGVSWTDDARSHVTAVAGLSWVSDPLAAYADPPETGHAGAWPPPAPAALRRQAASFFQANRFLAPVLTRKVCRAVDEGPVVDLYAGVGLFALSLAAAGHRQIVAIEGDAISAIDLEHNAEPFATEVRVVRSSVERYLAGAPALGAATLIVDPPRTGISRDAMAQLLSAAARRIVYVSCDVATFARDTRRLIETGYRPAQIEALDLFPNTPHVEVLAVFERST